MHVTMGSGGQLVCCVLVTVCNTYILSYVHVFIVELEL